MGLRVLLSPVCVFQKGAADADEICLFLRRQPFGVFNRFDAAGEKDRDGHLRLDLFGHGGKEASFNMARTHIETHAAGNVKKIDTRPFKQNSRPDSLFQLIRLSFPVVFSSEKST